MNKTLTEIIFDAWDKKCVEPKQRWIGGKLGWAIHRFPIKGGISRADLMCQSVMKNNALFDRLKGRK